MEEENNKEKYEKIRKKYSLPSLEELNKNFGVELNIEEPFLSKIVEKIMDEINNNSRMIESIIFVNQSSPISDIYQRNMVEDKDELFELYKELMKMYWEAKKIRIKSEEKEMAEFTKKMYKKWEMQINPFFIKLSTRFNKKWGNLKLKNSETSVKYYG